MKSFLSDCREAFVISWSYGMGDPLAPSEGVPCRPEVEGNRGRRRHCLWVLERSLLHRAYMN